MIDRAGKHKAIQQALSRSRAVLLTGARQVGKTTLARTFVSPDSINYFDLENPADLARLDSPMSALEPLTGTVVIDEVQRRPELFPILRVLCDRQPVPARFLILGSAAPSALRQASESLTGRIEMLQIGGLSLEEVGAGRADDLWLRGGYPESFVAATKDDSAVWRDQYVRNLASRDLADFGFGVGAATIERFLMITAGYHAQLWNSAAPARAIGISESSSRKYIDALADALLVRVLRPWSSNTRKRVVKSPKVYFRDSGLLHSLLGIREFAGLLRHQAVGASWEGFVAEQVFHALGDDRRAYFWRTSNGLELDLLLELNSGPVGIEIKRSDAPTATRSMHSAVAELGLSQLLVVYAGTRRYELAENIVATPLAELADEARRWGDK